MQLIQILRRHRRPVTGDIMARELEVSLRTVYRDIATLTIEGVPIRGEAGVGYVLGEGYDLPPLMFTTDELEAVMLGLRWVARRGDKDLARAALDTVAKIGTVLPEKLRPFLFDAGLLVPPRCISRLTALMWLCSAPPSAMAGRPRFPIAAKRAMKPSAPSGPSPSPTSMPSA